jgi:hypothetical protein
MSMIRKGMKIAKLIWNAVFSSLVMNAGIIQAQRHVFRALQVRGCATA